MGITSAGVAMRLTFSWSAAARRPHRKLFLLNSTGDAVQLDRTLERSPASGTQPFW
jgi:hypothetical protein